MSAGQISSHTLIAAAGGGLPRKGQQPSRRLASRSEPLSDLWVYWHSKRHGALSRVHDLSIGGLLIETPEAIPVGEKIDLNFLVQEGHIRAQADVRHVEPGFGLGLKFTAIRAEDRPRLVALLTRIRAASQRRDQSKQSG
jgi:PilZ domain